MRGYIVPLLAALVLIAVGVRARAADALPPVPVIDCALVRYKVAEHGKARALAWAIENGFSFSQIREARRCLQTKQ